MALPSCEKKGNSPGTTPLGACAGLPVSPDRLCSLADAIQPTGPWKQGLQRCDQQHCPKQDQNPTAKPWKRAAPPLKHSPSPEPGPASLSLPPSDDDTGTQTEVDDTVHEESETSRQVG